MEMMQWVTLIVFGLTILAVITNVVDSTLAALVGVAVMCWLGVMTEADAFKYVDWNVIAILLGIWIIAGYFGKSGVPSWLSIQALKLSGGRPGLLVIILTFLAGFISMFVDNVVTILMMAPGVHPTGPAGAIVNKAVCAGRRAAVGRPMVVQFHTPPGFLTSEICGESNSSALIFTLPPSSGSAARFALTFSASSRFPAPNSGAILIVTRFIVR